MLRTASATKPFRKPLPTRTTPEGGDVVVREERREGALVYVLHPASALDQLLVRTRDEAASQAVAYAKHQHVRAWFAKGADGFVLLSTFQEEPVEPGMSPQW